MPFVDQQASSFDQKGNIRQMLDEKIQRLFIDHGWSLSVAESCTGGAIASRLTKIPGASQYFLGGVVSYSNEMKEKILHVPKKLFQNEGAVSEEVVTAMVKGVIEITGSEYGIAVTGIAGPAGGSPEKPIGTVWIAVSRRESAPLCRKINLEGSRSEIIDLTVEAALLTLLSYTR